MSGQVLVDASHHDWEWKYQQRDGVQYICVEYAERCAAEMGISLVISSFRKVPSPLAWLDVNGDEWLYAEVKFVQELISETASRWNALRSALTQPQPSSSAGEVELLNRPSPAQLEGILAALKGSRPTHNPYLFQDDFALEAELWGEGNALVWGRLADTQQASLAAQQPAPEPAEWEHVATRRRYVELCRAEVQASNGPVHEGDWVVIYRAVSLADGRPWAQCFAREVQEFGERFTPLAAQQPQPGPELTVRPMSLREMIDQEAPKWADVDPQPGQEREVRYSCERCGGQTDPYIRLCPTCYALAAVQP